MGRKKILLDKLKNNNVNVHEYVLVKDKSELIDYSNNNQNFTIRFDRTKNITDLPFYVFDSSIKDKELFFDEIINEANKLGCELLLSNGIQYDKYLKYNFVIDIDKNYNFILELCDKKIPLRLMYKYKTTIIKGNLLDKINSYEIINKEDNKYTNKDINTIIEFILENNYKYIEGSLYSINVGILNKKMVIWQTN